MTLTYPPYTLADSGSQDAVEAVGIELVRRDELRGSDAGEQNEVKLGVAEQILGRVFCGLEWEIDLCTFGAGDLLIS